MKKRVQSTGSDRPWGFFILTFFHRALFLVGCLTASIVFLSTTLVQAFDAKVHLMKRRQQGILTGMPFMANLAPRTFIDDTGRKVFLANPPQRIISLAPSITEILYALGAGDSVVGVTEFCDYPPETSSKPRVGASRPNLEAIIGLKPDLVLAMQVVRTDVFGTLEQLKIPLFIMEAKTLEDIYSHIRTLGRMLERVKEANSLATSRRQDVQVVADKIRMLPRPRVLYVWYGKPFITVGPGSFIHQLIELAGGENVASDAGSAYPRLSMEVVVQKDPEIIVFPAMAQEGLRDADLAPWKRWPTMTAVKTGNLHHIPWGLMSRPGPRIVQGLVHLAKIIHPEVFQGQDGQH